MKIVLKLLLAVALLATTITPVAAADAKVVDEILAVVEGAVVTSSEVDAFIRQQGLRANATKIKAEALEALIDRKIILLEAKKRRIRVSDEEVESASETVRTRLGLEPLAFKGEIEARGASMAQYKEELKGQILQQKLIGYLMQREFPEAGIALREYFLQHKEEFSSSQEVRLLHASFSEESKEATGATFLKEVKAGGDFKRAAERSGVSLIDTGLMSTSSMASAVFDAIKDLSVDETSAPVILASTVHIFHLVEKSAGELSYESVKDEVQKKFETQGIAELFTSWLETRREKVRVEYK